MELSEYSAVLRKYWVSIVAVTLVGLVLGTAAAFLQTRPATAESAIFISVRDGETARELLGGAGFATTQVRSYMLAATTPLVLRPVIDQLGLDVAPNELAESLDVTNPVGSNLVVISVVQQDPALAASVAQSVAEQLVRAVENLSPKDPGGQRTVTATIISPGQLVSKEGRGFSLATFVMGLLAGLTLGLGQAVVRLLLNRSVSTAKQAARVTGQAVLAEVPFAADPLASSQLDPYRRLRTNLRAVLAGQPGHGRSFLVTSASAGEGKTTTAINLAKVFAAAGDSVLLIDANLHSPRIAEQLNLGQEAGVTSLLQGQGELGEVLRSYGDGTLHVVVAGAPTGNPADLLTSARMTQMLDQAAREYDWVVVDAPALTEASEAAALATVTGGALLVVGTKVATLDSLEAASRLLLQADVTTLGVLMNRNKPRA